LLVRVRCQHLGIAASILDVWMERYDLADVAQQSDWLPFRHPRDPAAMLVSAVQGGWEAPPGYEPARAEEIWADWMSPAAAAGSDEEEEDGQAVAQAEPVALGGASAADVWAQVLEELRMQMTRATFDTWLRGTQVVGVGENALVVRVRDGYAADWLRARWRGPIERTLSGMVGQPTAIRFEV